MDSMVGQLDIVLNASADKATQEIEKVNVKLDQLTSKAQAQAQKMVAGNRASADSLSGIATGVQRNVEAIDKLGQRSDALLGKQHTVWLGIGAVVGGQTDSMIKKVVGFLDRVNAIPGAVESGFRPLIQAQWLANDSLELSNATLKNQIALIEKKPQNNAAVALAEAKIESDKLAASLQAADEKMDAVLSANHISAWRLLLGKGPTANVEGTIKSLNEQISDLGHDSQVALHNGDQDEFNRLDKERRAMLEYAHQHFGEMEKNDQPTGVAGFFQGIGKRFGLKPDTSGSRAMLTQADTMVLAEQDADKGRDTNAEDKAQLRRDQDAERAKQAAQAASAAAQAAREKQYRDQMAGFEQQLAGIELGGELIPWLSSTSGGRPAIRRRRDRSHGWTSTSGWARPINARCVRSPSRSAGTRRSSTGRGKHRRAAWGHGTAPMQGLATNGAMPPMSSPQCRSTTPDGCSRSRCSLRWATRSRPMMPP